MKINRIWRHLFGPWGALSFSFPE